MQEVNIVELEAKYGSDLAEKIKEEIEHCTERELAYKIEVIEESKYLYTLAFATCSYTTLYEVSKKRKCIDNVNFFGRQEAMKALKIMNSLR